MREYRDYFGSPPAGILWTKSPTLVLIAVTSGCFLLQAIWGQRSPWFTDTFSLDPEDLIERFWIWQVVTYAFLHDPNNIWHLLFNMLILYFFGREMEQYLGTRRFLFLYFGSVVFAGLTFAAIKYLGDYRLPMYGASGAVMGVLVATALIWPKRTVLFMFLFPIQLRYLVIGLILIDLYQLWLSPGSGHVAHLAHLGGAAFGLGFIKLRPWTEAWLVKKERKSRERDTRKDLEMREEVDRLLAKIARDGMPSLTQREKDFLNRASRKYRR